MRKFLLSVGVAFWMVVPAHADPLVRTLPQAAQFLKKLNLYYYCPNRQGLKNFKCEVHIADVDQWLAGHRSTYDYDAKNVAVMDNLKYGLSMDKDGNVEWTFANPDKTGDYTFDNSISGRLDFWRNILHCYCAVWSGPVGLPQFRDQDVEKEYYQAVTLPTGFNVVKTHDKKVWTFSFASNAVLTGMAFVDSGKTKQSFRTDFTAGPQGLLISRVVDDEPEGKFTDTWVFQYAPQQGFQLPTSAAFTRHYYNQRPTDKDFQTQFTFSNFTVNESEAPGFKIQF